MAGSQGHCSWAGLNPCGTALLPQHKELCSLRLSEFTEGGRAGRGLQLSVVQDEPKESCGFIPFLEASMLHEPYVMPSSPIPSCVPGRLHADPGDKGLSSCHLSRQMQVFAGQAPLEQPCKAKQQQQQTLCPRCCCSTPSSERNHLHSSTGCTSCFKPVSRTECNTAHCAEISDELAEPGAATVLKHSFSIRAAPLLICLLLTLSAAHEFT